MDPLEFIAEFLAEVTEHLNTLDEQLLLLERDPLDIAPVRAMFLAAHSIKGGASMMGQIELRELSHALEDVLGTLRDNRRPMAAQTADVLFRAVDRLRALVPEVGGVPQPSSPETLALVAELAACVRVPTAPPPMAARGAPRVLLVEDSPSVRQVETFLLQDAGFVVDSVEAANEALELARVVQYVLVIVGIETREMRGPDLVLAMRRDASGPHVPVLLTTTDPGPSLPGPTPELAFAPKGRLGTPEFVRAVRDLALQAAVA